MNELGVSQLSYAFGGDGTSTNILNDLFFPYEFLNF
jgi:hypothetical protein